MDKQGINQVSFTPSSFGEIPLGIKQLSSTTMVSISKSGCKNPCVRIIEGLVNVSTALISPILNS
jgi:hypothetical protein